MLQEMRASIWKDPVISKAFVGGETEKSMFWQDEDLRNREQESNHDTGAAS